MRKLFMRPRNGTIAALDVGSTKVCCLIARAEYDKNTELQKKFEKIPLNKMKQLILKYYGQEIVMKQPLKEKLKWDAIQLNFMKKTSRAKLPI